VSIILTDIEGTTGSIAFVKNVLFPYARERIPAYLAENADEPQVATLIRDAARDAGMETLSWEEAATVFLAWMDADLKVTTLKTLQGMIWESGYRDGVLRGHVYDDAAEGLARWHEAGHKIYVYSSGSIAAQRLLFAFSDHGDLSGLFSGYFDTTIGLKNDPDSYRRIAPRIGAAPADIIFLSDSAGEIAAAHTAGLRTVWMVRSDTPPQDGPSPTCDAQARTFDEIDPDTTGA